jgi:trans-aconitate methyltransferase
VEQRQLVELIRPALAGVAAGSSWADLGAGEGNFPAALRTVLPAARLVAVDRDRQALERLAQRLPEAEVRRADFREPLGLRDLDGVLMANALHFLRDKRPVLELVRGYLAPGGRLVVVEYGSDRGNPWVPHPFSFPTWRRMAEAAGFADVREAGSLPSRFLGSMYCAWCLKPP